ncbi:hypothetical protein VTN00DRAFT_5235 [Thermoascus crustaceus]|uniref:uncharacterized protein n=1 Tax=Thermoascus crustaceus TaxID=5088 RepID=UPI0037439327
MDQQHNIRERLPNLAAASELPDSSTRELHRSISNNNNPAPTITRPEAAVPGLVSIPQDPFSSTPSTTPSTPPGPTEFQISNVQPPASAPGYPDVGTLKSWRGGLILVITASAQMLDNVFMTGANISLPAIQREFGVGAGDLQWMISAYTLTFGGYGRKNVFCIGLLWLSLWTIAIGFGTSFIQLTIFRALQGVGAAMTVPSAIGIISSYFVAQDRSRALSVFAAAGGIGFCTGLVFGGFLTSSLGWRYIFRLSVILMGTLGAVGFLILPRDRLEGQARPRLDILGAGLSTGGLILLSFVLSSGGVYGWNKSFIIALLVISVVILVVFTYLENKVSNPVMPLSLWKIQNFAGLWIAGFVVYGGYQTVIYYLVLIAQEVNKFSAGETAVRFLPMGTVGCTVSLLMGKVVERFNVKTLLLVGVGLCMIAPVPSCLIKEGDINFWKHVFLTSIMGVAGVSVMYITTSTIMLSSVPVNVKSLCGGMINTAFQLGSGVALALTAAIVKAVDIKNHHGIMKQYSTGLTSELKEFGAKKIMEGELLDEIFELMEKNIITPVRPFTTFNYDSVAMYPTSSGCADDRPQSIISLCNALGAQVEEATADVCYEDDVWKVFKQAIARIAGVIQGGMALRDKRYEMMIVDDFHTVISSTVQGTWNLHNVCLEQTLDFFTLPSSISGVEGQKGHADGEPALCYTPSSRDFRAALLTS